MSALLEQKSKCVSGREIDSNTRLSEIMRVGDCRRDEYGVKFSECVNDFGTNFCE